MASKVNPPHYKRTIRGHEIEVVDIIEAWQPTDSHLAHAITYILRAGHKSDSSYAIDLNKAIWWCMRALWVKKIQIEIPDFFKGMMTILPQKEKKPKKGRARIPNTGQYDPR